VGLSLVDREYKRVTEKPAAASAAELIEQLQPSASPSEESHTLHQIPMATRSSSPPPPPPPSPPPPPPPSPRPPPPPPTSQIPATCWRMCGHTSCWGMMEIGMVCDDTRLVCGGDCAQCCDRQPPPPPPPPPAPPPPLAPCLDLVADCADEEKSICVGVPTLAKKICAATCGLCESYAPRSDHDKWWWVVPAPEALTRASAGTRNVGVGVPAGLLLFGLVGVLAVFLRIARPARTQECLH
jgi:hypothetical protein